MAVVPVGVGVARISASVTTSFPGRILRVLRVLAPPVRLFLAFGGFISHFLLALDWRQLFVWNLRLFDLGIFRWRLLGFDLYI
jgi:hypothetical protein